MTQENFFNNRGQVNAGLLHLNPTEALACCQEGAVLVDVREDYMGRYKMLDVPEWLHMPCSTLVLCHTSLPVQRPLILADTAGIRSREAYSILKQLGYTQIANLAGGMIGWEKMGLPIKIDPNEMPTDQYILKLKNEARKNRKKK